MGRKSLGVFYGHSSSDPLNQIKKDRKALENLLRERFHKQLGLAKSPIIYVIAGRQEHQTGFSGDWEKWQRKVVSRKHATTGDICYHMFVVPGAVCGRATAAILSLAMEAGRRVAIWDRETGIIQKAIKIQAFDAEDWATGFRVTTE
jgi:hypothetical protein|tara:strand:- start:25 stop:465 length:441 start_codon:yes stop_codon:yes gene_type:complete